MEKKRLSNPLGSVSNGLKTFMLMLSCLFCIIANAQNNSPTTLTAEDHYQAYMLKYPASPLVKLYQHNPAIGNAYKAMKYAVILENPRAFGDYSGKDIEIMQQEFKRLMSGIEDIDARVQKGESYERAADMHSRELQVKQSMDERTRGIQSTDSPETAEPPALSAPK